MYVKATTLDDLLRQVYERLLKVKDLNKSTRGDSAEVRGALLKLSNPRARLSRTETRGNVFSGLGELFWYLAKSNNLRFIAYYLPEYKKNSDDNKTLFGAYGPRLFNKNGIDQISNVRNKLRENPGSRRAVVQLFDATDLVGEHTEIPCTCTLQFMLRKDKLDLVVSMRSNDAYLGLPHDVFTFTMLQEIMARSLCVEVGTYIHMAGSLHLYDKKFEAARTFLREGWQSTIQMPSMPEGNPWPSIAKVLKAERMIRSGHKVDLKRLSSDPYWKDLVFLLKIYKASKTKGSKEIPILVRSMASKKIYEPYIEKRRLLAKKLGTPKQKSKLAPLKDKK
jgi:thymidylate synthase